MNESIIYQSLVELSKDEKFKHICLGKDEYQKLASQPKGFRSKNYLESSRS